jgi:hypothetical protein
MGAMHASSITSATIRVTGQVPTDISISHLGTPEQEASLRVGELLIYLRDPHIAGQVAVNLSTPRKHPTANQLALKAAPGREQMGDPPDGGAGTGPTPAASSPRTNGRHVR